MSFLDPCDMLIPQNAIFIFSNFGIQMTVRAWGIGAGWILGPPSFWGREWNSARGGSLKTVSHKFFRLWWKLLYCSSLTFVLHPVCELKDHLLEVCRRGRPVSVAGDACAYIENPPAPVRWLRVGGGWVGLR